MSVWCLPAAQRFVADGMCFDASSPLCGKHTAGAGLCRCVVCGVAGSSTFAITKMQTSCQRDLSKGARLHCMHALRATFTLGSPRRDPRPTPSERPYIWVTRTTVVEDKCKLPSLHIRHDAKCGNIGTAMAATPNVHSQQYMSFFLFNCPLSTKSE